MNRSLERQLMAARARHEHEAETADDQRRILAARMGLAPQGERYIVSTPNCITFRALPADEAKRLLARKGK